MAKQTVTRQYEEQEHERPLRRRFSSNQDGVNIFKAASLSFCEVAQEVLIELEPERLIPASPPLGKFAVSPSGETFTPDAFKIFSGVVANRAPMPPRKPLRFKFAIMLLPESVGVGF